MAPDNTLTVKQEKDLRELVTLLDAEVDPLRRQLWINSTRSLAFEYVRLMLGTIQSLRDQLEAAEGVLLVAPGESVTNGQPKIFYKRLNDYISNHSVDAKVGGG